MVSSIRLDRLDVLTKRVLRYFGLHDNQKDKVRLEVDDDELYFSYGGTTITEKLPLSDYPGKEGEGS